MAVVVDYFDLRFPKHLLDGWIQLSAALLDLQSSLWPTPSKCHDDFQASSTHCRASFDLHTALFLSASYFGLF